MKQSSYIGILLLLMCFTSCYTFNMINIPEGAESIQVNFFDNEAPLVVPTLSQDFTEGLKDEFNRFTNLEVVNTKADLIFQGSIIGFSVNALAPRANETTALNRLTMTVRVEYINTLNEEQNWTKSFSRYEDFDAGLSLTDVQDALIEDILELIIDDVFDKAFGDW